MKTIDEVIDAIEKCDSAIDDCAHCAYYTEDCENLRPLRADALHYLKHLQEYYEMSREHHEPNPALTWEQLKQLEGKPVWVEDNIDEPEDTTKYWAIYQRIDKAQETEYALLSGFCYDKAEYGKTWQVYRKER